MTITNSTQNVLAYGWNGTNPVRMEVNASGHQKVNVENAISINTTGLATDTKQDEGNTLLTDIKTNTTQEAGAFSYSKALPVVLTTYEGGASLNVVGSQSGNVKVYIDDANPDFVANSGMATGTAQATGNGHLSAIQTAVQGTLTVDGSATTQPVSGSVSVSNFPATQPVSGSVSVSNNTDPSTGTKQDAQTSLLSTVAGAVSGTEMQVDIVSGSVSVSNNTDPATATKQDSQTSVLSSIDSEATALNGKVSQGYDSVISAGGSGAQQVLIYGRDTAGNLDALHTNTSGDLNVEIADFVKGQTTMSASFPVVIASDQSDMNIKINAVSQTGTYQNLQAGTSLTPGSDTTAVDITNVKHVNIVYEDTATSSFDGLDVLVSGNGGTNYNIVSQLYPTVNTAGTLRYAYISLEVGGLDFIKLQNNSSIDTYTSVNASAFGSL